MQEQQQVKSEDAPAESSLALDITLYTLARLGMLALAVAILMFFGVPFLVSAAVGVVVVMPLSMFVFGGLRRRVAVGMAERTRHRREQRERLRAELRGERGRDDEGGL